MEASRSLASAGEGEDSGIKDKSAKPQHNSTQSPSRKSSTNALALREGDSIASALNSQPSGSGKREKAKTFPHKLYELLSSQDAKPDVVAWLDHGKGFEVKDREKFALQVLPKYFGKQTDFRSFTRKLLRWNFKRVSKGNETGSFYHPLFRRDQPELIREILTADKQKMSERKGPDQEEDEEEGAIEEIEQPILNLGESPTSGSIPLHLTDSMAFQLHARSLAEAQRMYFFESNLAQQAQAAHQKALVTEEAKRLLLARSLTGNVPMIPQNHAVGMDILNARSAAAIGNVDEMMSPPSLFGRQLYHLPGSMRLNTSIHANESLLHSNPTNLQSGYMNPFSNLERQASVDPNLLLDSLRPPFPLANRPVVPMMRPPPFDVEEAAKLALYQEMLQMNYPIQHPHLQQGLLEHSAAVADHERQLRQAHYLKSLQQKKRGRTAENRMAALLQMDEKPSAAVASMPSSVAAGRKKLSGISSPESPESSIEDIEAKKKHRRASAA